MFIYIARRKELVLTWVYVDEKFMVHRLWVGESDDWGNIVILNNLLREAANVRKHKLYQQVVSSLDSLPSHMVEELRKYCFSSAGNNKYKDKYPTFWVSEILKHAVQNGIFMLPLPGYFETLFKLSRPLISENSQESINKIVKNMQNNGVFKCKDVRNTITGAFGNQINLKFRRLDALVQKGYCKVIFNPSDPSAQVHSLRPYSLSFAYVENGHKQNYLPCDTKNDSELLYF